MENCIKVILSLILTVTLVLSFHYVAGGWSNSSEEEITTPTTTSITSTDLKAIKETTSQVEETKTKVETTTKVEVIKETTTKSTTAKSTTALTTEPQTSKSASKTNSNYLGRFKLTAYCPCSQCCGKWANGITATGVIAKPNHTIAVDPSVIPYGSHVLINGIEYVAEDCGGAIGGNHIDVFFSTHQEACDFGVQYADVYLVVD